MEAASLPWLLTTDNWDRTLAAKIERNQGPKGRFWGKRRDTKGQPLTIDFVTVQAVAIRENMLIILLIFIQSAPEYCFSVAHCHTYPLI
jgi:hypothetical protein